MITNKSYVFLNEWQGGDEELLKREFEISSRELAGAKVLLASYVRDEFCGEAFVLLRRDGRLYEINASHDSMGHMVGQWEPEETLIEALRFRLENGRLGSSADGRNIFADELRFALTELEVCTHL